MDIFKSENLTFSYPLSDKPALTDVNITITEGEFVVLCGKSGSGKTTFQSLCKAELAPKGSLQGALETIDSTQIGFVGQNPEYGIATHSVRTELAFGLQNIGLSQIETERRIAETAQFFSLTELLDFPCANLSGGQKQLLCLACVCAMHPKAIILDEPTSQIDPIGAERLVSMLKKLCDDFGITILISEHRLENLFPLCTKVIALDSGKVIFDGEPCEMASYIDKSNSFLYYAMPTVMRICSQYAKDNLPLTVAQGRKFIKLHNVQRNQYSVKNQSEFHDTVIEAKGIRFAYDEKGYVLKDFSVMVKKGEIFALMGENGSGKSTALKLLSGVEKLKYGKIKLFGQHINKQKSLHSKIAVLPQKCEALFAGPTIYDDLFSSLCTTKMSKEEKTSRIKNIAAFFEISDILSSHPYDVSGGQMQKSALAMAMLKEPEILFLDEPTKGMDNCFKQTLSIKLKELSSSGITVFMVCHDAEFCAQTCTKCAVLFDGRMIAESDTDTFFRSNYFYTTVENKLFGYE